MYKNLLFLTKISCIKKLLKTCQYLNYNKQNSIQHPEFSTKDSLILFESYKCTWNDRA